ncbi:hypothetical protein [Methylobacterium sp. Leaf85]|uniref:hypothetical protein n=1 Tax=Methylobacterium sp. Leaf85 TaxID=1736241 RepID=UPI0012E8CBE9|nr:hypothetical protein [Methylobacterium sp. Leaf85]
MQQGGESGSIVGHERLADEAGPVVDQLPVRILHHGPLAVLLAHFGPARPSLIEFAERDAGDEVPIQAKTSDRGGTGAGEVETSSRCVQGAKDRQGILFDTSDEIVVDRRVGPEPALATLEAFGTGNPSAASPE